MKSVIHRIVEDIIFLKEKGIVVIAIMSNDVNDPKYGKEDSFDNMKLFSEKNNFVFPYVYDETQNVGRNIMQFAPLIFSGLMQITNFSIEVDLKSLKWR